MNNPLPRTNTSVMAVLFAAIATACVLSGCSKPTTPTSPTPKPEATAQETAEAPQQSALDALFMKADELYNGGATNDALKCLEDGLVDPALANDKQQVFNTLIRMMVFSGMIDDARARMLDVYENDADLASSSVGILYSYYAEMKGDQAAALEWTETVLAIKTLPPTIRRTMREFNLVSHIQQNDTDAIISIAGNLIKEAPSGDAIGILRRGVDMLFDRKQLDVVDTILVTASKVVSSDESTSHFVAATKLRLLADRSKWDDITPAFRTCVRLLPDQDLQRSMRKVLAAATKAGKFDLSDSLCTFVLTNATAKTQSVAAAARQWADNAVKTDPAELPDRIEHLLNTKCQPLVLCGIFQRYFYNIIDNPAIIGEMKGIGERLALIAPDDDTRNSIRTMILDSCFLLEDYDSALKILREGVAGYDKTWHDMAITKVEAHKALKENRAADAIKHFRAFMSVVEISKESEAADPSTDIVHTKEMILGRNAKRIGDIYRDMLKDEASAKAAYAEARKYYQTTLDTKPEKEVVDVINAEMAEIPQ